MHEHPRLDDQNLDDQLAAFTDRLLAKEGSEGDLDLSPNPELRELQETLVLMKMAAGDTQPGQDMADRIRNNLVAEWRESGIEKQPVSLWERVRQFSPFHKTAWQSTVSRQRTFALSFAVALAAVVVAAVFVVSPSTEINLLATAGGQFAFLGTIVVGIIAGAIMLWARRSKD